MVAMEWKNSNGKMERHNGTKEWQNGTAKWQQNGGNQASGWSLGLGSDIAR